MAFENQSNTPEADNSSKLEDLSGAEFLGKKYKNDIKERQKSWNNDLLYSFLGKLNKCSQINHWLGATEEFHKRHRDNPAAMDLIRRAFHEKYAIKPEDIPESYFTNQQRLARERGQGNQEIIPELRRQAAEIIINDQKATLDNWINYLFSADADVYPMWAKYWALQSFTKLSSYDKEEHSFGKRRNDTVAPFPDLNREAFAYVIDKIVKKARKENLGIQENETELKKLIESENFGKLYAYAIEKVTPTEKNKLETTKGIWKKYEQKSDHTPLVKSLQGHGTGWCTAGESTAKVQLEGGDFYVFYSEDEKGNAVIPRVAIRMEGNRIGEVRGIAPDQNLDSYIGIVVEEKLKEFSDGQQYKKKVKDMELLTAIDTKQNGGQELTKEELRFLYEFDSKIEGFGYAKDPRIREIIGERNIKTDISLVTGYAAEQISLSDREGRKGGIKFHFGDLVVIEMDFIGNQLLILPETVSGDLLMSEIKSTPKVIFPKRVNGDLFVGTTKSAEDTILPEIVVGDLHLETLENAGNMVFPKYVGGDVIIPSIRDIKDLKLPEDLKLPDIVRGAVYISPYEMDAVEELKKKFPNLDFLPWEDNDESLNDEYNLDDDDRWGYDWP